MQAQAATDVSQQAALSASDLQRWQRRSDARGLMRLAGHLAVIASCGAAYAVSLRGAGAAAAGAAQLPISAVLAVAYGFGLASMFAAMHECVHRTAFKSQGLNDGVAWFAGLLSFYNSTFYRPYHGAHHRFTQLAGKDPELDDRKPTTMLEYLLELSGLPWWLGKLSGHFRLALGKTRTHPFLNDANAKAVVRSVRLQLLVYGAGIAASVALGEPYFVTYWLLPLAAGQPLLRAILLAEHTGCSEDDDALSNTRTTHTVAPIRFLMWQMPYHAEHHRYPALPFFTLAEAHGKLAPHLLHVARRGYAGFHVELVQRLAKRGAGPEQTG